MYDKKYFEISKLKLNLSDNELKIKNDEIENINNQIRNINDKIKSFGEYDFIDCSDIDNLRDSIVEHKNKINDIKEYIENGYYGEFEGINIKSFFSSPNIFSSSGLIWNTTIGGMHNNHVFGSYNDSIKKTYVAVTILKNDLSEDTINVYDDIFKSELGNYYLQTLNNDIVYLKKVIAIDDDNSNDEKSKLHKWYYTTIEKYIRTQKLKKLL